MEDSHKEEGKNVDNWENKGEVEEKERPENLFVRGEDFTKETQFMRLEYSYGYDCLEKPNLVILGNSQICFFGGNVTIIYNVETREQKYIWSHSSGGVGAIDVHPRKKYLAVAEKGDRPDINIYSLPELRLTKVLRGGALREYSCIEFNPNGSLLASVAGGPDYTITIWDWEGEQTILRSKCFSQDVYFVNWSKDQPGHLVTGGAGHIKFWKMAKSFTGLKLQGQIGMFGKTEISSITGSTELPDGKVLAGNEFGNVTLWEGGHIKTEIVLSNSKKCHGDQVRQFILEEDEITTISFDGTIKVWDFDTIDSAEPQDENLTFPSKPINELKVGSDIKLMKIARDLHSEEMCAYYAQDSAGAIWRLDLSFSNISKPPLKVYEAHSGSINGLAACPDKPIFATTGDDGFVRFYNYETKTLLCSRKFGGRGLCLIWSPPEMDSNNTSVVVGFSDGVIRVLSLQSDSYQIIITSICKPHSDSVVTLAAKAGILVSGSEDTTVFFFEVGRSLTHLGFVRLDSKIAVMRWNEDGERILVGCSGGVVCEIRVPGSFEKESAQSYHLDNISVKKFKFKSVKSRLLHEQDLARRKLKWEEEKAENIKKMERQLERNEITADEVSEYRTLQFVDGEEWSEYIPGTPSSVVHVEYEHDYFIILTDGYDSGFYYLCQFSDKFEPTAPFKTVSLSSFDVCRCCLCFGEYKLFGMANGGVRLEHVGNRDDGRENWCSFSIHDSTTGSVNCLAVSFDKSRLISGGGDGNIFCYVLGEGRKVPVEMRPCEGVVGLDDYDESVVTYSIEEARVRIEEERRIMEANERKARAKDRIMVLRKKFRHLVEENRKIPETFRLRREELVVDDILERLYSERYEEKKLEVLRMTEFDTVRVNLLLEKVGQRFVNGIECDRTCLVSFNKRHEISTYKLSKIDESMSTIKARLQQMLMESSFHKSKTMNLETFGSNVLASDESSDDLRVGPVSKTPVVPLKGSKGDRIDKALKKVEMKRKERADRKAQWKSFQETMPGEDYEDPNYAVEIQQALENMGNYMLKSADDYVVPENMRLNAEMARLKLIDYEETLFNNKSRYNRLVLKMVQRKEAIRRDFERSLGELAQLGPGSLKGVPDIIRDNFEVEDADGKRLGSLVLGDEEERIIEEMCDTVRGFDAEVYRLKRERCFLDIEMKKAQQRQITLFEELLILKDFQKGEEGLSLRISAKEAEKIALKKKIGEAQVKLDAERKDIERNAEKESQLMSSLKSFLEDGNKFGDYLQKLFRKRIKKKRKPEEEEDSELDSEEDSDSDDQMLDSEDEAAVKQERYDYESCPPSLDPQLYAEVYELRKKRTEIDDRLNEGKKVADQISKEIENLQKKLKTVEFGEQVINRELEAYQLKKQQTLNELKTTVVLTAKQICHIENGRLPEDLSQCLVFERSELRKLENRIRELESEKVTEAKRLKNAKKFARQLMTNKKKTESQLSVLREECQRMMVDKFGTTVNIELLESVAANRQLEEVRQRFEDVQNSVYFQIGQYDDMIRREKRELLKAIKESTAIKLSLVESLQDRKYYGDKLENKQKQLGQEFRNKMRSEVEEASKMRNYILAQNQEIRQLRNEIATLSRKDAVVLPPISSSKETVSRVGGRCCPK